MQPAVQKSAIKEQHEFQEGNIVNMVPTKLIEWADTVVDNVVYITVGKARNMVFVVKMPGQHTHKKERDTRRQIKEDKPRIAIYLFGIEWAGFEIEVEGFMIMIVYTVGKAEDVVYKMQVAERLIRQCEEYTGEVDCLLKEVFLMHMEERLIYLYNGDTNLENMGVNKEEFKVQERDVNMIEDTNTGKVVNSKSGEVIGTVIIVGKNNMIEVYVMQMTERFIHQFEGYTREVGCPLKEVFVMHMKERLIYLCKRYARQEKDILVGVYVRKMEKKLAVEDNDMGIVVILGFMEVIMTVFEMEYNTAGMQKRLTVEEGDINVSMEVVRTAIVEVVRTAITEEEYNTTEFGEKLTVKKGDIDALEDTYVGDMIIFHLVESVDIKYLEMVEIIVHKEEYNMAEVHKELTVEEGDTYMFEDIHMKNVNNIKFMEVVKKEFYNGKDGTRRREDIWSFRDIETRLCLILEGEGVS
jgi:hypothetical protein